MKVLIVDDEHYIGDELREVFEHFGHLATTSRSTDEALSYIRRNSDIDLIIADLKMPGKSGEVLISECNAMSLRYIKFAVISGHGGDEFTESRICSLYPNVIAFIRKPVGVDQIQALISLV